jgi:L-threonylcarbamoyladenylate synthase
MTSREIGERLRNGEVGVVATDTIYGLVGSALDPEVVSRIYKIKERSNNKPLIVLIASENDSSLFDVNFDQSVKNKVKEYWPGKTSIILKSSDKYEYLHRGTGSIAFRVPLDERLQEILKISGPVVAPSANVEGQDPASSIDEAKNYFGENVDFYDDQGIVSGKPSRLIRINNDKVEVLRE